MITVIQRVSQASVEIEGRVHASIETGFLVLLGITHTDTEEDTVWISKKVAGMRIFSDADGKMNLSLSDVKGSLLLISQFTLHASTRKGNRPSFTEAARPEHAIPLYEQMITLLEKELNYPIRTGQFGADMKVNLINDGPVTIIIDSKNRL